MPINAAVPARLHSDASTTSTFYLPLTEAREIRLLELLPGIDKDPIELVLRNQILTQQSYETISYTWGGPPVSVTCNGTSISISTNLRDALQYARSPSHKRWLWADQICINQDDEYEKDVHQIPLMNEIYSNASRVLVWLGLAQDDSDYAMDCFPQTVQDLLTPTAEGNQRIQELDQYHGRGATALNHLLRRDWFTRVWTLQEVAVARQAILICGAKEFDWKWLEMFNEKCQNENDRRWTDVLSAITSATYRKKTEMGRHLMGNIHAVSQLKTARVAGPTDVRHLHRVRSCGVTRPKDKVLALLPFLSTELRDRLLQVDNGTGYDTAAFYQVVAGFELGHARNMNMLSAAGLAQRSHTHRSMPSWVPDWTTPEQTHDLWLLNSLKLDIAEQGLYRASREEGFVRVHESQLHVTGRLVDEVSRVGQPAQFSTVNDLVTLDPSDLDGRIKWNTVIYAQRKNHVLDCLKLAEPCKGRYGDGSLAASYQTMMRGIIQDCEGPATGGPQRCTTDTEVCVLFEEFFRAMQTLESPDFLASWRSILPSMPERASFSKVILHVQDSFKARVFFITRSGYLGLGPSALDAVKEGDQVAVIDDCCTPLIVRLVSGTNSYQVIGEAYVHGLMDGEAMHLEHVKSDTLVLQ